MRRAALVIAAALSATCASQTHLTLPAVGPNAAAAPAAKHALSGETMTGTLVVYSESLPVTRHRNPSEFAHTGYVIRRPSGEIVAHVDNQRAAADAHPDEVRLAPGLYEVSARGAKVGMVLVPVLISPGRRTEVFLDEAGMPPARSAGLQDPVRLPDGRVVGARVVSGP